MEHKRSVHFYELLRQMSYSRYEVSPDTFTFGWGVKALKNEFDIPKDGKGSYMRSTANGGFDRANFERYVLDPICNDLVQTEMIRLVIHSDGKPYEKVHKGNRVVGYQFTWVMSHRPAVADAQEVKAIAGRVDKNPQILKVAKDIIKGQENPKHKRKDNDCNFEERDYDYDELLERFAKN